jgi:hypothetical protein
VYFRDGLHLQALVHRKVNDAFHVYVYGVEHNGCGLRRGFFHDGLHLQTLAHLSVSDDQQFVRQVHLQRVDEVVVFLQNSMSNLTMLDLQN